MQIVAVDPGVGKTGVVTRHRGDILGCTFIETTRWAPDDKEDPGRLLRIAGHIKNYADLGDAPSLLVIEDTGFLQGPGRVNIALHHVIRLAMAQNADLRTIIPAPTQVKKFATGSGASGKTSIGTGAERHWSEDIRRLEVIAGEQGILRRDGLLPEDVLEALVLMKLGQCYLDQGEGEWTGYQHKVALHQTSTGKKLEDRRVYYDSDHIRDHELVLFGR